MKLLKFITAFFSIAACTDTTNSQVDSITYDKKWNIKLKNNLGNFEIALPKHLDTLFTWTQYSDCGDPCAKADYRIQPKSLPIFKETGFYYHSLAAIA